MTKLGDTQDEVFASIKEKAEKDLSELLETTVIVETFSNLFCIKSERTMVNEWNLDEESQQSHITIEDTYPIEDIVFEKYLEDPSLLRVVDAEVPVSRYHSALLRSRCRVTAQPDSGDVFVYIKGKKTVDPISLLEYIVSFRDECHFHEEICEAIYKRLWDLLEPEELNVMCLYARRGGWDICPERASNDKLLHSSLGDASCVHVKMPRQ
jgi:7-cyano-7-deazaguanine reductase